MVAVAQGRATDRTHDGVRGFKSNATVIEDAIATKIIVNLIDQSIEDCRGFPGSGIRMVGTLNLKMIVYVVEHVSDTGARPGTHIQKDVIEVTEGIQPQYCRINPAIDWNEGRGRIFRHAVKWRSTVSHWIQPALPRYLQVPAILQRMRGPP